MFRSPCLCAQALRSLREGIDFGVHQLVLVCSCRNYDSLVIRTLVAYDDGLQRAAEDELGVDHFVNSIDFVHCGNSFKREWRISHTLEPLV